MTGKDISQEFRLKKNNYFIKEIDQNKLLIKRL